MAAPSTLESILERQVRSWEIRTRLAGKSGDLAERALAHLAQGPWVSISRQLGSGGTELARQLSEILGWQVFDREILSEIARNLDTREVLVSHLDEHGMGPLNDYLSQLLDPQVPGRVPFLQEMMRVIWTLARKGDAIILGRGANWFLDSRFGLRVRVVAALERRIESLREQRQLALSQARSQVTSHDAEQQRFVQQVYSRSIDDPLGYDLVLHLDSLDVEAAAQVCAAALRLKLRP